jgi:predicted Zn-dependent protease
MTLTLASAVACGGTGDGESKAVAFIPAGESLPPTVVETPVDLAVGPVFPEPVTYVTAESAFAAKRYSEAAEMFAMLVADQPQHPWNHYMLGISSWKAGDPDGAQRAFTAALELDPKHLKSELNLSRVLLEVGRPVEALAHVEKGLAIDSTSGEVWRLVGRVQGQLGNVEPALTAYRRAISLDEKDVWAMNNMGLLLINAGRFQEALGPLARATELRAGAPVFQNNLGMALERLGYYTTAAAAYKAAVAGDSTYSRAIVSLARVEKLEESTERVAVDLPQIARTFAVEVGTVTQGSVVMVPPPFQDR